MAYYDHEAAAYKKECRENYEKLMDTIANSDEYSQAYEYIKDREREIQDMKNKIDEYRKFFESLQNLLPRRFSINDTIG